MKFASVELLKVGLDVGGKIIPVGRLAVRERRILFRYDSNFITSGLELSPFRMPLLSHVHVGDTGLFEGLPGLVNDSLPDGWGRLLLDRQARRQGVNPNNLSVLDRLACVGSTGMGALVYEPDRSEGAAVSSLDLDRLAIETSEVLEGQAVEVLDHLIALNASSQGARPKIMVAVSDDKSMIRSGVAGEFTPWLIKFAARSDEADIGRTEYAYSLMAREAGIDMPETHLFTTATGAYFGTRRFDRHDGRRIHMHSLSGLIHADHRIPSLDYDMLMRVAMNLTRDIQQVERAFALSCFNVFARNRDDHGKNFAFLMSANGQWQLSPAYDLTFSSGPNGEHSTTVMGEGRNPGVDNLRRLGIKAGLKKVQVERIIERAVSALAQWPLFATQAGVPAATAEAIQAAFRAGIS